VRSTPSCTPAALFDRSGVLLRAAASLEAAWTAPRGALPVAAVLSGGCLYGGLFVFRVTAAVWGPAGKKLGQYSME